MGYVIILLLIGLVSGVLSGLFGIGGGVVIVPALMFFLGYTQKMAQGTTLFMLMLPVVALGAYKYYQAGNVSIKSALIMCLAFPIGAYLGALGANMIPGEMRLSDTLIVHKPLSKLFAVLMFFLAIKLFTDK